MPNRLSRLPSLAGILVAASLVLAACGSSGSPATLNTAKVARAIERSSFSQRGERARVSCPSSVPQRKGLVFSCTAVVKGTSTRFVVAERNGSGDVHYEAPR